jgi:ribulose-5-phosphate 4-epimerase/fuculose-1-phosphate aldolase
MSESALREDICRFGRSLFDRGLSPGSSGNITVRLDDGGLLCTPTNVSLGALDPARLTRLDASGRTLSGDAPTKEIPLHAALYSSRATAGAIVHLHSTHSVAVSMLPDIDSSDVLPALTAYYVMRVGRTVLIPYYAPGDPAIGAAIRGLAGRYSSVLLSNHGPIVAGTSLESAVYAIEELEETAKLHLLLRGHHPRLLTQQQVAALQRTLLG